MIANIVTLYERDPQWTEATINHVDASTTGDLSLTAAGRAAYDRLVAARRDRLDELLERWEPEKHAEVEALVRRLAAALVGQLPRPPQRA